VSTSPTPPVTPTVELDIPADSVVRLNICNRDDLHPRDESCVRGISEPVVAAELRRLADLGWVNAAHLRARADELDGGAA
jgi:hypothetical protein